jgi:hypothetical protein
MKKLNRPYHSSYPVLVLVFFLGFLLMSYAPDTNRLASGPKIVFEKLVHDYGTIPRNSDGTCYFKFTNKGDDPLVITGVKAACGCTVPSYTREPILPGQSGQIKVEYNTRQRGTFSKTIVVNTNDQVSPATTLTLKGNVVKS